MMLRKTLPIILIVALVMYGHVLAMNSHVDKNNEYRICMLRPPEDVMFGLYMGKDQEVPFENYTFFRDAIDRFGFDIKNISDISSMMELSDVDVLVIMTQKTFSNDEINVLKNYTLSGGSILFVLPAEITSDVEDLLDTYGIEKLGVVEDNISYYNKETFVILNGSWANITLMNDIHKLLVPNATALNFTGEIELIKNLGLEETASLGGEEVPIYYVHNMIWGLNTTYVEYSKGKKLYGENISVCIVEEFWFGGRVVVLSSPYMFEDRYVVMADYDNLNFMWNIILWLGQQSMKIGIDIIDREPSETRINITEKSTIRLEFRIAILNVTNDSVMDNLTVLAGFEHLGKFKGVKEPKLEKNIYHTTNNSASLKYEVTLNIRDAVNTSAVIFIRIVAIKPYYGFNWNKAIRIEALKFPYKFMKFHESLYFIVAMIALNLVAIVIATPYILAKRRRVSQLDKKYGM